MIDPKSIIMKNGKPTTQGISDEEINPGLSPEKDFSENSLNPSCSSNANPSLQYFVFG